MTTRKQDFGIKITVQDAAGPKMRKLGKNMPLLIDKAVRITAARHRRRLVRWIRQGGDGTLERKDELDGRGKASVQQKARDGFTRSKHIHRSHRALSGRIGKGFWRTMRYTKITDGVYQFGFTTPSAEFFADLLARGVFMDPLTKRQSNQVTPRMAKYLGALGLNPKGGRIDMPKRPVIDKYFAKKKHLIYRDINNVFNSFFRKFGGVDTA